jgi:hypothetical protein
MTVLELKQIIAEKASVPVELQKVIFRGRVMKDSDAVSVYGIVHTFSASCFLFSRRFQNFAGLAEGYTVHLVARPPDVPRSDSAAPPPPAAAGPPPPAGFPGMGFPGMPGMPNLVLSSFTIPNADGSAGAPAGTPVPDLNAVRFPVSLFVFRS